LTGTPKYIVQPLGKQDRAAFHSGTKELDAYLLERAPRDVKERLSAVFVLLTEEDPHAILGYYTLSSLEIEVDQLPEALQKRTGKYKRVGATLLGRLAVAEDQQGKKLGEFLLMHALKTCLDQCKTVSSFAVVVDAKNDKAAGFYEKYGFLRLAANRLFLPLETIAQSFAQLPAKAQSKGQP
jgi:predicted GNAT family N-acyltransferase